MDAAERPSLWRRLGRLLGRQLERRPVLLPVIAALGMMIVMLAPLAAVGVMLVADRFNSPDPDVSIARAVTPLPAGTYSINTKPDQIFSLSIRKNHYVIANPGGTREIAVYFNQVRDGANAYIARLEDIRRDEIREDDRSSYIYRIGSIKPDAFCTKRLPKDAYDEGMFEDTDKALLRWIYTHASALADSEDERCWIRRGDRPGK